MKTIVKYLVTIIVLAVPFIMNAQQILLDKPVRAGELVLFPELNNEISALFLSGTWYFAGDAQ